MTAQANNAGQYIQSNSTISADTWIFITMTKSASNGMRIYINAVLDNYDATKNSNIYYDATNDLYIGTENNDGSKNYYWDGNLDELRIYDHELNQSEINNLYNCNNITGCATPVSVNFSITAISNWTGASLNNFNATIDGVNYTTSTGTITTHILNNDTSTYNITVWANDRFSTIYADYNVSSNLEANLKQNIVNITPQQLITNATISNFSIIVNGSLGCNVTGSYCVIYPDQGIYTLQLIDNTGESIYHTTSATLNVSTLEDITKIVYGHGHEIFVYARTLDNSTINNFVANLTSLNRTDVRVQNTTTGVINFDAIHDTYNITVNAPGYALYDNWQLVDVETGNYTLYYYLYPDNSIDISIYDETSGALLNGTNITVTKILGAAQQINITSTGTIGYSNLTAGNYTFTFEGTDYPQRSYSVEIGNRTYQTLNVYLLANTTDAVIFTFQEYSSNNVIEDVTLQISKIINGSDTLIAVLTSDITGRTQFYFDTTERYCFSASKTGYTTKEFCLDPIIFSSYTIKLQTSVEASTGDDYEEILIDFVSPTRYWNEQNNTVTFKFATPEGELTNYGFNATYNSTTITKTGTNAYGSILTDTLEITGAEYGDKVIVYYWYKKSSDTEYHTFKRIYEIYGYTATTDSLVDNPPEDYGLGEFEKTLISTGGTLLVGGAAGYYGGPVGGGIMAIFMLAWFMYIGFLNFWAGIISIIILFIVIGRLSTR